MQAAGAQGPHCTRHRLDDLGVSKSTPDSIRHTEGPRTHEGELVADSLTFTQWLTRRRKDDTAIGDLARDAAQNTGRHNPETLERLLFCTTRPTSPYKEGGRPRNINRDHHSPLGGASPRS